MAWGRVSPVTRPSLADWYWITMAISEARASTQTRGVAVAGAAAGIGGNIARIDIGDTGDEGGSERAQRPSEGSSPASAGWRLAGAS